MLVVDDEQDILDFVERVFRREYLVERAHSVEDALPILERGVLDVLITDEGKGFDPTDVPDPTAIENLERPCGRGLMLMRHYMTAVTFHGHGNAVQMCKVRVAERNGQP